MVQLADLFSLPEMSLLCNVSEFLHSNSMDFHPESLFLDIKVKNNDNNSINSSDFHVNVCVHFDFNATKVKLIGTFMQYSCSFKEFSLCNWCYATF